MQKNTASQKWVVFAFEDEGGTNPGEPVTGDAANITANVHIDGGAANSVDDTNPAELAGGYYIFDITAAESNGDNIVIVPSSATANVNVIGVPGAVWTVPANFPDTGIESDGHVHADVKEWIGTAVTLGSGAPDVNIASSDDIDLTATQKASVNAEVDNALDTAIPGTPTADSINERVAALDDLLQSGGSGDAAAILTDTNSLNDTKVPDTISLANINAEVDTALTDIGLDHLLAASVIGTDVTNDSIVAQLVSKSATADWDDFDNTTDSLQATRDHIGDGTNLTEVGGTGDHLTAIPWNSAWDAEVQSEVNDGLVALGLDHLVNTSVAGTDVADDSIFAKLVSASATADWDDFVNTDDSLQALETDIAAILTDTNSLNDTKIPQTLNLTASGNIGIDWANVENPTTAVDLSGTDIQLADTTTDVTNRVTANTDQINGNATAAANLERSASGVVRSAVNDASASTTSFVTDLTEATDDHFNGRIIVFTSGNLANQATDITDYTGSTKTVTVTALTEAPADNDEFVIV